MTKDSEDNCCYLYITKADKEMKILDVKSNLRFLGVSSWNQSDTDVPSVWYVNSQDDTIVRNNFATGRTEEVYSPGQTINAVIGSTDIDGDSESEMLIIKGEELAYVEKGDSHETSVGNVGVNNERIGASALADAVVLETSENRSGALTVDGSNKLKVIDDTGQNDFVDSSTSNGDYGSYKKAALTAIDVDRNGNLDAVALKDDGSSNPSPLNVLYRNGTDEDVFDQDSNPVEVNTDYGVFRGQAIAPDPSPPAAPPSEPPSSPPSAPPSAPPNAPPAAPPSSPPNHPPSSPPSKPPSSPPSAPPSAPPHAPTTAPPSSPPPNHPPSSPPSEPPSSPPSAPPHAPPAVPPSSPPQTPPANPPQLKAEAKLVVGINAEMEESTRAEGFDIGFWRAVQRILHQRGADCETPGPKVSRSYSDEWPDWDAPLDDTELGINASMIKRRLLQAGNGRGDERKVELQAELKFNSLEVTELAATLLNTTSIRRELRESLELHSGLEMKKGELRAICDGCDKPIFKNNLADLAGSRQNTSTENKGVDGETRSEAGQGAVDSESTNELSDGSVGIIITAVSIFVLALALAALLLFFVYRSRHVSWPSQEPDMNRRSRVLRASVSRESSDGPPHNMNDLEQGAHDNGPSPTGRSTPTDPPWQKNVEMAMCKSATYEPDMRVSGAAAAAAGASQQRRFIVGEEPAVSEEDGGEMAAIIDKEEEDQEYKNGEEEGGEDA